jgi:hypothetical protein
LRRGGWFPDQIREDPFGSPRAVEPLSAVGVVVGAIGFTDLALKDVDEGGAERRLARFARRSCALVWTQTLVSAEDGVALP